MKKEMILCLSVFTILLGASKSFSDGWSEPALGGSVSLTIETVTTKDDGSVFVKFTGANEVYWFQNKPNLLAEILTAKSTGAQVRAWTTTATGYYNVSDIPFSGLPQPSSAHYLGAIQIQ